MGDVGGGIRRPLEGGPPPDKYGEGGERGEARLLLPHKHPSIPTGVECRSPHGHESSWEGGGAADRG